MKISSKFLSTSKDDVDTKDAFARAHFHSGGHKPSLELLVVNILKISILKALVEDFNQMRIEYFVKL